MNLIQDGGPAFPQPLVDNQGRIDNAADFALCSGMSLRDNFAIKFAAAQISMEGMEGCDKNHVSAMAYEMANAMLAERSKQP